MCPAFTQNWLTGLASGGGATIIIIIIGQVHTPRLLEYARWTAQTGTRRRIAHCRATTGSLVDRIRRLGTRIIESSPNTQSLHRTFLCLALDGAMATQGYSTTHSGPRPRCREARIRRNGPGVSNSRPRYQSNRHDLGVWTLVLSRMRHGIQ